MYKDDNFKIWVDTDFSGNWDPSEAMNDPDTACSHAGFFTNYMGVPILWKSTLIQEVVLSTTEAEYVALSLALRKVIPIVRLIEEMEARKLAVSSGKPEIRIKVYDDNVSAITMAQAPSMQPRTKYLNVKWHWFRSLIQCPNASGSNKGMCTIHHVGSTEQTADFLTKPLGHQLFLKHRKTMMGW